VTLSRAQLRMDLGLSTQPYVNNQARPSGFQLGSGMALYVVHAGKRCDRLRSAGDRRLEDQGVRTGTRAFALGVGADSLGAEYFFRDSG